MTRLVKDNEAFVALIRAAQEDPELRRRLITILALEKRHRKPALHSFLTELRLRGEPEDLLTAVACLIADDVARTTVELLQQEPGGNPPPDESARAQLLFAGKLLAAIPAAAVACWHIGGGLLWMLNLRGPLHRDAAELAVLGSIAIGAALGGLVVARWSWRRIALIALADILVYVVMRQVTT